MGQRWAQWDITNSTYHAIFSPFGTKTTFKGRLGGILKKY